MDKRTENLNILANKDETNTKINRSNISETNINEDISLSMSQIFNFPILNKNAVTWIECTNFYLCHLCNCSICGIDEAYIHITQDFHKQNLRTKTKEDLQIENNINILNRYNQYFWCGICRRRIKIDSKLIQYHCLFHLYENLPKSCQDILQYSIVDRKPCLKCCLCDVMIYSDADLGEHLTAPKHMQILDLLYNMNEKVCWSDLIFNEQKFKYEQFRFNFQPRIHLKINNQNSARDDLNNYRNNQYADDGNSREKQYYELQIKEISKELMNQLDFVLCITCNRSFGSFKSFVRHCRTLKHKSAVMNIHLVMSDSLINFIQPLDYTKFFLRLSIHGNWSQPKRTTTIQSDKEIKNIAYQEDVIRFGDQYISMCIENDYGNTKSIYRLNSNRMHLLKLGISLTFTYHSYRVCIPCGYKFQYSLELVFEHLQHEVHLKKLQEMENNAIQSQDRFNLMYLAKSCIGLNPESKDYLKCFTCETSIRNNNYDIEDHLKNPVHIRKMKIVQERKFVLDRILNECLNEIWYYTESFFCDVCNLEFEREISFAGHLNQPQHLEKVKEDKSNCEINICFACSNCWYGRPCFSEHYNKNVHVNFVKKFQLVVHNSVRNLIRHFDSRVDILVKESNSVDQAKDLLLLQSIEKTVQSIYPSAKAHSFGSRFSCLGLSSSDVDIYLDCENNYNEIGSQEKSRVYIKKIVKGCLEKDTKNWRIEKVLLKTRVPIIKLEHMPTHLQCDISFLNGLGVEKSKLIRIYVMANPIYKHFMLFLKKWFQVCRLYGSLCINGYAVTWFSIFFLQVKGLLPSVYQLISMNNESITVDGWECGFSNINIQKQDFLKHPSMTLSNLTREFFAYYAKFKYREQVACPFLGKVLKKESFVTINNLPPEMGIYKERMKTIATEHFRYDSPLAIQDPVDLSQNITKAVTKTQLRQFRYSCLVCSKEKVPYHVEMHSLNL